MKYVPLFALLFSASFVFAEDVTIAPDKVAQLHRLEPLKPAIIDAFVAGRQLTPDQAAFVKAHIDAQGHLELPASNIGVEAAPVPAAPPPASAVPPPAPAAPPTPPAPAVSEPRASASGPLPNGRGSEARKYADPYASFHYTMPAADQERCRKIIAEFRFGDRKEIGRELREYRPAVNSLVAAAYRDQIDMPIQIALWDQIAGPKNPDAAIGLFETHRMALELARPILVPFEKDAGGVRVVRHEVVRGANVVAERFFTSRELRNLIDDVEGLIAKCQSSAAAVFLMNVYADRYGEGEAAMRDTHRDRKRLAEACGGNEKHFDEDDPKTWQSTLSGGERATIADALIPWVSRANEDRRQIARNGLMICLGRAHPKWDAGREVWEEWWKAHRADVEAK